MVDELRVIHHSLSYGHQSAYAIRFHGFTTAFAGRFHPAHYQVLVGQLGGKIIKLLDQQDGHVTALGEFWITAAIF